MTVSSERPAQAVVGGDADEASPGGGPLTSWTSRRYFAAIIAVKYWSFAAYGLSDDTPGFGPMFRLGTPGDRYLIVAIGAAVVWTVAALRPTRLLLGVAFAAMCLDAAQKIDLMGQYFLNHLMLEVLLAVLGVLTLLRLRSGEDDSALLPLRYFTIACWVIPALKKLLLGTYLSGEYLASIAGQGRGTPIRWIAQHLLISGGKYQIPQTCCYEGRPVVSGFVVATLVGLGIAIVAAEFLPGVLVALGARRTTIGTALVVLSILAAVAAIELDFGLTNLALATLWTSRRWSRIAALGGVAFGIGMHVG